MTKSKDSEEFMALARAILTPTPMKPLRRSDIFFNEEYIEIHTRLDIAGMLPQQRANLLHALLSHYDPGLDSPDYEKFQDAAGVVLGRVDQTLQEKV